MRQIIEHPEDDLVVIDGIRIVGSLEDGPCECGSRIVYFDRYDALFCPECNTWLQARCSDPRCGYCVRRPAQPLPT